MYAVISSIDVVLLYKYNEISNILRLREKN